MRVQTGADFSVDDREFREIREFKESADDKEFKEIREFKDGAEVLPYVP